MPRLALSRFLPTATLLLLAAHSIGACRSAPVLEAPMLREQVEAGELPPLEQRLPSEPARIESIEGRGQYGGSLRMLDAVEQYWSMNLVGQAGLFRFDRHGVEIQPDLAAGFQWSEDYRSLELRLRPGHKWSDGHPFTTDDILFWWEAYASHPAFEMEDFWRFESGSMQLTKIDDTTVRFDFPEPYPVVMDRWGRALLSTDGLRGPILPRHYLERFHPDYDPEAEALAEAEGHDSWRSLFEQHADSTLGLRPERPSLWMWVPEARADGQPGLVRNPYFHQVDRWGSQLPYIDRIEGRLIEARPDLVSAVAGGEVDIEGFYIGTINLPQLEDLARGHSLRTATSMETSLYTIHFNLNAQDPTLRSLFGQRDFRRALSLAIDRKEIAEQVFDGHARPSPALPLPQHSFYDPDWTEPLLRFDPEEAGRLLDGLGMVQRDAQGMRRSPTGQPLRLTMQMHNDGLQNRAVCERVSADWAAIGIDALCRGTTVPQLSQWQIDNETELPVWATSRSTRLLRTDPRWFGFESTAWQWWAPRWTAWLRSEGREGEQPPAGIRELDAQFQRWQALPYESEEANALARSYFGWFAEQQPMIGTVGLQDHPLVVADRLRGVPDDDLWWGADINFYTAYLPGQWWLDD